MPTPDDQHWIHRWNATLWSLLGLGPTLVATLGDTGAIRFWSLVVLATLAAAYVTALRFPVTRPAFLALLILGLGASSYLRGGGAALFIVSLPHFWIFTGGGSRRAATLSGLAAASTVFGGVLQTGDAFTGNSIVTVSGLVAGTVLGLSVHRALERSEARARRLAAELELAQRNLAEAHHRQGVADERERLAREIHDTLAQGFASIIVLAEAAHSHLQQDPTTAAQQLRSIEATARENLTEARVLVGTAPPTGILQSSLAALLRRTVDRFTEDTGLTVTADLPDIDSDQPTRIALLRCTQESLANIRKHAQATTVGVVLTRHPHGIELEVTDDGRGFTPTDTHGFGLDGMRRRLAELGGDLTVTSAPSAGTRILATIPAP